MRVVNGLRGVFVIQGYQVEVIVVNNNSTDNTEQIAKENGE
jgi:glycosyltransferase involved in cell wall biosynthesis